MTDRLMLRVALYLLAAAALLSGCFDGSPDEDGTDAVDLVLGDEPVEVQVLALHSWGGRIDPVKVELCRADGSAVRAAWSDADCPLDIDAIVAGIEACDLELSCDAEPTGGRRPCTIEIEDGVTCSVALSEAEIEATGGPAEVAVGGAASLAAWWHRDEQQHPQRTWIISTGDAWGASPPLAAAFAEEPAVRALGLMGVDIDTLGNHNFDRGLAHLQSMLDLASYSMLAANLTNVPQNVRGIAPYRVVDVGGLPVAFIGLTDPDAVDTVFPGSFGTMTAITPLEPLLEARDLAAAAGARLFVVVAHLGLDSQGGSLDPDPREIAPEGQLMRLWRDAQQASGGGFDVVFGYGAERNMICRLPRAEPGAQPRCEDYGVEPRSLDIPTDQTLLVQGREYGRTYPRIVATMIPSTGEMVAQRVEFELPELCGTTDRIDCDAATVAAVEEVLEPFRAALAETRDAVLGQTEVVFEFEEELQRSTSTPLGSLVADALRRRTDADLCLLNSGSIDDRLPAANYTPRNTALVRTGPPPLTLVRGDIDALLPFLETTVVTLELTADELFTVLEHGVSERGEGGFPQVSGLDVVWAPTASAGERICRVTWTTAPEGPRVLARGSSETLQVATVDFLAQGGDGYRMLSDKTQITRGGLQDMVAEYVQQIAPLTLEGLSSPRVTALANGETCADLDVAP